MYTCIYDKLIYFVIEWFQLKSRIGGPAPPASLSLSTGLLQSVRTENRIYLQIQQV